MEGLGGFLRRTTQSAALSWTGVGRTARMVSVGWKKVRQGRDSDDRDESSVTISGSTTGKDGSSVTFSGHTGDLR